jgi:hypothetical protein
VSHDRDRGDKIVGIYSTRRKALARWKQHPQFAIQKAYRVGHSIQEHKLQ